ncbi:MAG: TetR/AcrR family transcriptional regulator [Sphaerobacteraceae bacterium]|nr:MAG: TetR/AcrR family transcriptional regulator [Sphaerobacteraceae bacterium]
MVRQENESPRDRVVAVAEHLFSDRGYKAVTLRDIADDLGIRQASLYHHFPKGKEELFVEVTERAMQRHAVGMRTTIAEAPENAECQLKAIARWMLSQPPIDMARMVRSDMVEIEEAQRHRLMQTALRSLILPIEGVFDRGIEREHLKSMGHSRLLASSFLSIIEAIQVSVRFSSRRPEDMADEMIDILMDGLRPR